MATYGGHISLDELAKMQAKRGVVPGTGGGAAGFAGVPYGDLASQINAGMTGEAMKPYAANLPNYAAMVGKRSENIMGQLAGNVPDDVVNQIIQTGAERGILTGSAMSPNANSAMLRALGLTSLGMQQQGSQNLTAAINDTPVPQLFNPASLIVPETLAKQQMDAATAGRAAGATASVGTPWGGGVTINPYQGGRVTPEIPRWNPGASPVIYGPGGGPGMSYEQPAAPNYDNWWDTYGQTQQTPQTQLGDPFEEFWNLPLSADQPDQYPQDGGYDFSSGEFTSPDPEYDYWGF